MAYDFVKDPAEVLDYGFDLTDWLTGGEHIVAAAFVDSPSGKLTLDGGTIAGSKFAVWVAGGTIGDRVRIQCRATTDSTPPRVFVRTANIAVQRR